MLDINGTCHKNRCMLDLVEDNVKKTDNVWTFGTSGPLYFSPKCRKHVYRLYHNTRDCTIPACEYCTRNTPSSYDMSWSWSWSRTHDRVNRWFLMWCTLLIHEKCVLYGTKMYKQVEIICYSKIICCFKQSCFACLSPAETIVCLFTIFISD